MQLTSEQCRKQEAIQRARAEEEPLANVRIIALNVAIAWRQEALAAERREALKLRTKMIAELRLIDRDRASDNCDRALSENPDRGFAEQ